MKCSVCRTALPGLSDHLDNVSSTARRMTAGLCWICERLRVHVQRDTMKIKEELEEYADLTVK